MHSFAIGHTPVKTVERLIAKLVKSGQNYWLYGTPLKGARAIMNFILRNDAGSIVEQWKETTTREVVHILRASGFAIKTAEGLNIANKDLIMDNEIMKEDHFSPDEVAAIKNCEDQRVRDFYREYVRAEAVGDMSRADMMATMIKDRCELLGITVQPQMSEEPCGECGVPAFESWEARMKAAGAKRFDEDAADAMVRAIKVVEGKDFVLGEFDKALDVEVFEQKSPTYSEYTMEGTENDETVWMEKVTAEGATSIKKVGYTQVAFIGESRIGRFTSTPKERKIKSFSQIISESASTKEPLYEPLKFPTAQTSATNIVDILKLSGLKLDEAWANAPDEKVANAETQLITMSGGINRKKKQVNPDNPADNPLTMKKPAKAGFLNIEEEELAESLEAEFKKFIPEAAEVTEEQDEQVNESGFENDPYGQGYAAGYKGHSAERCPYGPGTPEKDQWYSGWQDGREEMRYKSREDYSDIDRSSPYESKDLSVYANKVVAENVEYDGNIGDEVIITGNVQFNGATGVISDFGQDRRFVIVDLYNHGKKSFHASDVSINDYADSEEERSDWEYEDDVPEFMGKRGLGEDENNTAGIWQDVINAIAMGYPDIDPVDSLKSVMRKHNIRDFGFFDQLARKNGYSDIYAVADEFMSESKEGKQYTGRETKDGVWRVFEKGKSVAVAGPFDSAEEANKWIKDKTTVNESDDDDDEEWYDKDGRPSKSGAYDAGGHYHKERDTDKDDLTESVNALKKLSGLL